MWLAATMFTTSKRAINNNYKNIAGYGDVVPESNLGKVTSTFVCLWGMFLHSALVLVFNNELTLNPYEQNVSLYLIIALIGL
jgi:hypothetical protein